MASLDRREATEVFVIDCNKTSEPSEIRGLAKRFARDLSRRLKVRQLLARRYRRTTKPMPPTKPNVINDAGSGTTE